MSIFLSFSKKTFSQYLKPALILTAVLLASILLASCSSGGGSEAASIGDMTATGIDISHLDKCGLDKGRLRIVSVSPTATEMLFVVGAASQVVAVDEFSNYPPKAPRTGLSGFNPNTEAIAEFEPNIVVTSSLRADDEFTKLESLGICVVRHGAADDLEDVYLQLKELGATTGNFEQAAQVVEEMKVNVALIREGIEPRSHPLTYFYELDNTLYSVTDNTFVGRVLGLLNLTSIAPTGPAGDYPQLNAESLLESNPDLILLADTLCCSQTAEKVAERAGWDALRAVQNGHILELNDDIASRWGPRIVDLMAIVSEYLQENFQ